MIGTSPPATDAAARHGHLPPAIPWRAVALSALLVFGIAAAVLPVVAAHTGGWLARNDGLAYFLYARALVLEGGTDPTAGYRQLDARLPPDPLGPLAALRESARRLPGSTRIALPWPIGAGLLMAPFYAAGWGAERLAARLAGRAPDSFGFLPQLFYGFGAVTYGLLGFWASFLTAARVANPGAAALAVLALMLGGPAVFYVFLHPTMAHAVSLGLASLLVLMWWRLWEAGDAGAAGEAGKSSAGAAAGAPGQAAQPAAGMLAPLAAIAALLGLLVLVRYQNVALALLPAALLARLALRQGRRAARTVAAGAALLVLACAAPFGLAFAQAAPPAAPAAPAAAAGATAPATGAEGSPAASAATATAAPVTGAAGPARATAAGEAAPPPGGTMARSARGTAGTRGLVLAQNRFDLRSPHFFAVLVSCQHGAFYWTPVLGVAAAALAWAAVRHGWARALAAVLLANVYLVGCLAGGTNWSGDNAYGMRYLTESLPLLAPPLAALVAVRPSARWAWAVALALLVAANGLLMLAFSRRTIAHDACVTYRQMAAGIVDALPGGFREPRP